MTADVTVLGSDATALYKVVRYAVLPLHHYGNEAAFDASANKFGFTKGDLSGVTAKHSNPLGAGPYTFVSNENNIVTLKANEHYFKGTPKIQYLNFRVTPVNDRINDVAGGEVDIASVDASKLNLDQINGKAGAVGAVTSTAAGYGYVGINANTVSVGDGGSDASKNLRKGIATLIAVYRSVGIKSFFGEVGQSIEVPMSKTWFGYPENPALAYSVGVDGKPFYTVSDAQDARVTAAKAAAKAYFEAAGYAFEGNKLATTQTEGLKTSFSVMFVAGSGGSNDNAAVATLDLFKAAMEEMGFTVTYDQKSSYADQSAILSSGSGYDLWAGTWSNPDRYVDVTQLYGSEGSTNYYHLYSAKLDGLVEEAKVGTPAERLQKIQAVYAEIMDWAVEVPLYQRVSITIYSTANLKAESIPGHMTAYYGYFNEIHNLELAG
jgi:peptide/nickel transport system substrate-binding protein